MIPNLTKSIAALALALALPACETAPSADPAQPGQDMQSSRLTGSPFDRGRVKLLFGWQDSDARMTTEERLVEFLEEFDVRQNNRNLRAWINAIRQSDAEELHGLGGVSAQDLLLVANATLNPNNNFSDRPGVETYGQIEKQVDGELGYYFDGNSPNGSGHLWVTMFTKITLGASDQRRTIAHRYKVVVTDGFQVEPKDLSNPGNVFPDFASESGITMNSSMASGFNSKLWAKGTSIQVTRLLVNKNYDNNPTAFVEINENNPNYKHVFETDPSACIDMMFADATPPDTLPDDAVPPYYCLGRCDNPPIINTK